MLAVPGTTPYDLRFRLFNIPVRIHPLFWVAAAVLGWNGSDFQATLIWIGCVLVSIVVHEYGHGLMAQRFGSQPRIILWWMGGLCVHEAERRSPRQQLAVLICGPAAGLALVVILMTALAALKKLTLVDVFALCMYAITSHPTRQVIDAVEKLAMGRMSFEILYYLLQVNLLWSFLNLLPIYPLDGGQIAGVVFKQYGGKEGTRRSHILSLVTSGIAAAWFFSRGERSIITGLLFASLALVNYQILQSLHQESRYGGSLYEEDEADWWKR
jgi:stage IV sporulation protein FB